MMRGVVHLRKSLETRVLRRIEAVMLINRNTSSTVLTTGTRKPVQREEISRRHLENDRIAMRFGIHGQRIGRVARAEGLDINEVAWAIWRYGEERVEAAYRSGFRAGRLGVFSVQHVAS